MKTQRDQVTFPKATQSVAGERAWSPVLGPGKLSSPTLTPGKVGSGWKAAFPKGLGLRFEGDLFYR